MKENIIDIKYLDKVIDKNNNGKRLIQLYFKRKYRKYIPKNVHSIWDFFQNPSFVTIENKIEMSYTMIGIHWFNTENLTPCSINLSSELNNVVFQLKILNNKVWA